MDHNNRLRTPVLSENSSRILSYIENSIFRYSFYFERQSTHLQIAKAMMMILGQLNSYLYNICRFTMKMCLCTMPQNPIYFIYTRDTIFLITASSLNTNISNLCFNLLGVFFSWSFYKWSYYLPHWRVTPVLSKQTNFLSLFLTKYLFDKVFSWTFRFIISLALNNSLQSLSGRRTVSSAAYTIVITMDNSKFSSRCRISTI